MSISNVRSPYGSATPLPATPARPETQRPSTPSAPSRSASVPTLGNTTPATPAVPPTGTDPELWSVLTADERTYFAKLGAMGPLTYGRVLSGQLPPSTPSARGVRLDVKA